MRAVVLVGGFGTRLRPLTNTVPKQLLPVAGLTMIERVAEHLARHGVDDVVLSMGYLPDLFERAFPDGRCAGVRLHYAVEPEPLDTGGAIAFAAAHAGIDSTFLVRNGDVLTDLDLGALVEFHRARGAEATLALTRVDDPSQFGVVPTDDDGRVLAFVEKPAPGTAPTDLINAGTYVFEPAVLDRITTGARVSVERETFPAIVADGRLFAVASDAAWVDAGTPAKYIEANLDALGDDGTSMIGEGTEVDPDADVERSVLGDEVRVAAGAVVRRSVLLDGATVGAGAVVEDSVLGVGARVEAGASVLAHSVIGGGVTIDAGARLEGVRYPESP